MPLSPTYNPKPYEERVKILWKDAGLGKPEDQIERQTKNQKSNSQNQEVKTHTIIVPPPNLTGNLHVGHALEHFLMDTLSRIARQNGLVNLYLPGVDHAGIQLEGVINKLINNGEFNSILATKYGEVLEIEKENRANYLKKNYPALWLELAWSKAREWRSNQMEQAEVIGDTPDFSRLLFTLDGKSVNMVNLAFEKYWQDGLIYRDKYLINWSVGLQTALSDVPEDIGHIERVDPFVSFDYRLERIEINESNNVELELKNLLRDALSAITVSTVRPETIYADVAVAIHPAIFKQKLMDQRLNELTVGYIIDQIVKDKIKIYFGIEPLNVHNLKLIIEESVDPNFGTGCLKITPAHSLVDYEIAKKHGIEELPQAIGRDGKLTELCYKFAGLTVEDGRLEIIRELVDQGFVPSQINTQTYEKLKEMIENEYIEVSPVFDPSKFTTLSYIEKCKYLAQYYPNYQIDWEYKHNVTICERSKTVVEPLISEEFFVDYYKQFSHKPERVWEKVDYQNLKLETERLILSPIDLSCVEGLMSNMTKEDAELVIAPIFNNKNDTEEWIRQRQKNMQEGTTLTFSIRNKLNGDFIGTTGLRREEGDYKLTIWVAEKFKRQGIGMETIEALCEWGFATFPVDNLIYEVKTHNDKSIALAQKCGFTRQSEKTFVSMDNNQQRYFIYELKRPKTTLQELAIQGLEQVNFYPPEYRERGIEYFKKIRNWCISRDLIWGHKMPIWYNLDTNPSRIFYSFEQINTDLTTLGKNYTVKDLFRIQPDKPTEPGNWVQEEKILDTWFSSTLWPLSTLDYSDFIHSKAKQAKAVEDQLIPSLDNALMQSDFATYYPTQLMTSAWEIFYAWIIRMVMTGMYFTGTIPFEEYCCHPWVLDEKGRKMSKSLGNVFDPSEQINKYSADSTRLAMLSGCIPGKNLRFQGKLADTITEKYRNFGNKLWNVARFIETKIIDEDKDKFPDNKAPSSNQNPDTATQVNATNSTPIPNTSTSSNTNPVTNDFTNSNSPSKVVLQPANLTKSQPNKPSSGHEIATLEQLKPIRIDFDFKRMSLVPAKPQQKTNINRRTFNPTSSSPQAQAQSQPRPSFQTTNQRPQINYSLKELLAKRSISELQPASVWILSKYIEMEEILNNAFKTYNLATSIEALYEFVLDNLASWYIEYLKIDSRDLPFAYNLFKHYIVTLSPYAPFETEVLWTDFFEMKSILGFQTQQKNWATNLFKHTMNTDQSVEEFQDIITCIEQIRSLKGLFGIDPVQPITIFSSTPLLLKYKDFLKLLSKAELQAETKNTQTYTISNKNYTFSINIFDYIKDADKEIEKTIKLIESLEKQIAQLDSQLNNPTFMEKASEEIINDKTTDLKARKADLEMQKSKLTLLQAKV